MLHSRRYVLQKQVGDRVRSTVHQATITLLLKRDRPTTLATITMGAFPDTPDWSNLSVLHRNTLPPRANFKIYNSESDALSRDESKARVQSLAGTWKFHLANSPFEAPEGFEAADFDKSQWSDIPVPGMWQLQCFGDRKSVV